MLLTIFTPAYNRAEKLKQIYNSLKEQSSEKYEWLIVDDGSNDNTERIVVDFCNNSSLNIRYVRKENGGKHTAHNMAVDLAKGDYFMCLDSDDYLNENAIEILFDAIDKCQNGMGIIAYKSDQSGRLLSGKFPKVFTVKNTYTLNEEYSCRGEFVLIYPTNIMRKNKFPVFKGEKFITECVVYDQLRCPMQLLPKIIEVCEYQSEGLTNNLNEIMRKNPAGYCLYFMQRIDMQKSFKNRVIIAGKYKCFSILANKKKSIYKGKYKWMTHFCFPLGRLFWLYYKIVRKF